MSGFFDKTLEQFGYERQESQQKGVVRKDYTTASGALGSITGANSWNPAFSSFNNERQQLLAYRDWVYTAAHKNAEVLASIDLRIFEVHLNGGDTLGMAQKLMDNPREARKYLDKKVNYLETKGGTLILRKGVPALEEIYAHPLLKLLNHPNPYMVKNEFLEITGLHMELTGNAYWFIARDKKGKPAELWPLLPNGMAVVPDETHFIIGYVYTTNGKQIPLDPKDVIHHKYGNPMDFRHGYSPVMAGSVTIDADAHASTFNQRFFYNTAMPDGFLTTEESMDEKTFKRLKTEWMDVYGGAVNSHRTAILSGGLTYKNLQITQRDMEFLNGRNFNRDMILALFGVPKSTLGFDESMSRANADTADYILAKNNRIKMQRITNRITMDLAPQFGNDNLIVSFTDPVPEDKAQVLDDMVSSLGGTNTLPFSTINEVRAKRGDLPVPGGNEMYISSNLIPMSQILFNPPKPQGTPADIQEEEDNGQPEENETNDPQDVTSEDGADDGGGGSAASTSAGTGVSDAGSVSSETSNSNRGVGDSNNTMLDAIPAYADVKSLPTFPAPMDSTPKADSRFLDDKVAKAAAPQTQRAQSLMFTDENALGDYIGQRQHQISVFGVSFSRAAKDVFTAQKAEVLMNLQANLVSTANIKSLERKDAKKKLADLFDAIASAQLWSKSLSPVYKGATVAAGNLAANLLNDPQSYGYDAEAPEEKVTYSSVSQQVDEYFAEHASSVGEGIDQETLKQLRAELTSGINAGDSLQALIDRVEKVYSATSGYRAQRIAITEANAALQYANNAVWKSSNMVESYIWLADGPNPCPICQKLNGTVHEDPSQFPAEHVNGVCAVIPYKLKDLTPNTVGA